MTFIVPPERTRFYQLPTIDHWNALYRLTGFDMFILIPYLAILMILAVYGLHRYHLVYLYLKNKHKVAVPKSRFGALPKVTVQLPIYNEMYVVERLVESVCRISYPRELLEIQVLDDSTDATKQIAAELSISIKAVKRHRHEIMQKLDIHDVAGLTRYALTTGMIDTLRLKANSRTPPSVP